MKNFRLILLVLLFIVPFTQAQDADMVLVDFENESFGIQGVIPEGWNAVAAGTYSRGASAADTTILVIQSAPLTKDALLASLLPSLLLDEVPEIDAIVETDAFSWDTYQVLVETVGLEIDVSIALTEDAGTTYVVILQSLAEEHDALRSSVFDPVLQSITLLQTEESFEYVSEDVTFPNGDITLAGTLTLPSTDGIYPAVVLISGSGASDRNESLLPLADIQPFAVLADHLTGQGIAVLRYDDRGVGESEGDYGQATLVNFASDAEAAVTYLLSRDEIDAEKIGLLGHSEGGVIAPMVATNNDAVAYVVLLAGPTVSLYDVLQVQNERIYAGTGLSEEEYTPIIDQVMVFLDTIISGDSSQIEAELSALLTLQLGSVPDDATLQQYLSSYVGPYWNTALTYDPATDWAMIDVPVLGLYGDLDVQVDADQNSEAFATIFADNSEARVIRFEKANHLFQAAITGAVSEYASLEQTIMPEVLQSISDWILDHFG